MTLPLIAITPGEPAGIGPDIVLEAAMRPWPATLLVFADKYLMEERADLLKLPVAICDWQINKNTPHQAGTLTIFHTPLKNSVSPGILNAKNNTYVLNSLDAAIDTCRQETSRALVTGPVHKAILNQAKFFSGHTEYLANYCSVPKTVMLFVSEKMKMALQTTHLPLKDVSAAVTQYALTSTLKIIRSEFRRLFALENPRIMVCGLNPHAGEDGCLGREEIDIIEPVISALSKQGFNLKGPVPADTAFLPANMDTCDVVLCMYHDQGLPVMKHDNFEQTLNMTLGLPFLRTSVDHGTALPLAGTGKASAKNLIYVLGRTISMLKSKDSVNLSRNTIASP